MCKYKAFFLFLGVAIVLVVASCGQSAISTKYVAEELAICTDAADQFEPAVSGDIVVWIDERNGNKDIYGFNLATDTEFAVCTDPADQLEPAISGDIVVWTDERNGNKDIYSVILSFQQ